MPKITRGLLRDIHDTYMDYLGDSDVPVFPSMAKLKYFERFKDLLLRVESECAEYERNQMRYEDCILPEDFMEGYDEVEDTVEDTVEDDEPFAEDMVDPDWKVYESTVPKEEGRKAFEKFSADFGFQSDKTPKRVTIIEY